MEQIANEEIVHEIVDLNQEETIELNGDSDGVLSMQGKSNCDKSNEDKVEESHEIKDNSTPVGKFVKLIFVNSSGGNNKIPKAIKKISLPTNSTINISKPTVSSMPSSLGEKKISSVNSTNANVEYVINMMGSVKRRTNNQQFPICSGVINSEVNSKNKMSIKQKPIDQSFLKELLLNKQNLNKPGLSKEIVPKKVDFYCSRQLVKLTPKDYYTCAIGRPLIREISTQTPIKIVKEITTQTEELEEEKKSKKDCEIVEMKSIGVQTELNQAEDNKINDNSKTVEVMQKETEENSSLGGEIIPPKKLIEIVDINKIRVNSGSCDNSRCNDNSGCNDKSGCNNSGCNDNPGSTDTSISNDLTPNVEFKKIIANCGPEQIIANSDANFGVGPTIQPIQFLTQQNKNQLAVPAMMLSDGNYFIEGDSQTLTNSDLISLGFDQIASAARPVKKTQAQIFMEKYNSCLLPNSRGNLPIHEAILMDNLLEVQRQCIVLKLQNLQNNWVDVPNDDNLTALQLAVSYSFNSKIISLLLNYGADMSVIDSDGNNVFHLAVIRGFSYILEILLNHYANQESSKDLLNNHNYDGLTPLIIATLAKKKDLCELLLRDSRVDPNRHDSKSGRTPLFHAIEINSAEIVQILMLYKADKNIKNFFGTSAHEATFELDNLDQNLISFIRGNRVSRYMRDRLSNQKNIQQMAVVPKLITVTSQDFMPTSSTAGKKKRRSRYEDRDQKRKKNSK